MNHHGETLRSAATAPTTFWQQWAIAWNRFWFQPADPATLGLIRICTGLIAFYSTLVWSRDLLTFFGDGGVLPVEYRELLFGQHAWSHFDWVQTPTAIWTVHVLGLIVIGLFTLGCWTRVTAIFTALLIISYSNRATGALFGLDQILAFLCLYLAVGNSGGAWSLDRWWKKRKLQNAQGRAGELPETGSAEPITRDIPTNIALRLIQLHLCLVYLFAGLGKLQGETWWNGQAIWYSIASYEYQTLDLTWMADWMWFVSLMTLLTVFWEVTYAALVWPKLTRPFVLAFAVITHLGIGIAMGMMTFGLVMLVANLAFVPAPVIRKLFWKIG